MRHTKIRCQIQAVSPIRCKNMAVRIVYTGKTRLILCEKHHASCGKIIEGKA